MKITKKDSLYMLKILEKIINIPSPTGYTKNIVNIIKKEVEKMGYFAEIDKKGGLIVKSSKNSKPKKCISSHLDTLGAMVKEVKSSGRIKFDRIGGYAYSTVLSNRCKILSSSNKIYEGTIVPVKISGHIYSHSEIDKLDMTENNVEIRLDELLENKKQIDKLGIEIGDWIFIEPNFKLTKTGFINSRHLDDKASAAIVLTIMKKIAETKINSNTMFHFSVYEEMGYGTSILPETIQELVCIDMAVTGNGQNSDEFSVTICFKDGAMTYDRELTEKLVQLSKDQKIKYKKDIYTHYGSDARGYMSAGYDIKTALIGMGVEASHAYERTHKKGMINTAELLLTYIQTN